MRDTTVGLRVVINIDDISTRALEYNGREGVIIHEELIDDMAMHIVLIDELNIEVWLENGCFDVISD